LKNQPPNTPRSLSPFFFITKSLNQSGYSHIPLSLQVCHSWRLVSKMLVSRENQEEQGTANAFYSLDRFPLALVPIVLVLDPARFRICVLGPPIHVFVANFHLFFPLTLVNCLVEALSSSSLVRITAVSPPHHSRPLSLEIRLLPALKIGLLKCVRFRCPLFSQFSFSVCQYCLLYCTIQNYYSLRVHFEAA